MDLADGPLDSRESRIARNEVLFREVNERVQEVSERAATDTIEFLCECGDKLCTQSISLRRAEYERLRSDPLLFGIKPGHAIPDVEDVVDENERFQTVRKHEEEGRIARVTDPRA
jgi:hypothetical protein